MGGTAMRGAGDMGAKSRPSPFIQLDHLELAFPVFERLDLKPRFGHNTPSELLKKSPISPKHHETSSSVAQTSRHGTSRHGGCGVSGRERMNPGKNDVIVPRRAGPYGRRRACGGEQRPDMRVNDVLSQYKPPPTPPPNYPFKLRGVGARYEVMPHRSNKRR